MSTATTTTATQQRQKARRSNMPDLASKIRYDGQELWLNLLLTYLIEANDSMQSVKIAIEEWFKSEERLNIYSELPVDFLDLKNGTICKELTPRKFVDKIRKNINDDKAMRWIKLILSLSGNQIVGRMKDDMLSGCILNAQLLKFRESVDELKDCLICEHHFYNFGRMNYQPNLGWYHDVCSEHCNYIMNDLPLKFITVIMHTLKIKEPLTPNTLKPTRWCLENALGLWKKNAKIGALHLFESWDLCALIYDNARPKSNSCFTCRIPIKPALQADWFNNFCPNSDCFEDFLKKLLFLVNAIDEEITFFRNCNKVFRRTTVLDILPKIEHVVRLKWHKFIREEVGRPIDKKAEKRLLTNLRQSNYINQALQDKETRDGVKVILSSRKRRRMAESHDDERRERKTTATSSSSDDTDESSTKHYRLQETTMVEEWLEKLNLP